MPTPDVDVGAMLAALERHGVEYVVIGGFAVELHDVAVPPTRDVDITPASGLANLERLANALIELEARFRVPDGPPSGVEIPGGINAEWLTSMVTSAFITSAGPLDVSLIPDGTTGYDDLVPGRVEIDFEERLVPVAALEDIVRSKEAAGRVKDIVVLPALRAHLRRQGR
ncbi:MAG: hypothetical protein GY720_05605 [bacterium]|nr:hypothetical protein [bacterium]